MSADLCDVDLRLALEGAGLGDLHLAAVGEVRLDPAFDDQPVAGVDGARQRDIAPDDQHLAFGGGLGLRRPTGAGMSGARRAACGWRERRAAHRRGGRGRHFRLGRRRRRDRARRRPSGRRSSASSFFRPNMGLLPQSANCPGPAVTVTAAATCVETI